ncbi:helix-turn-helix domain-containing protein [Streptomyces sp. SID13726]|uniref:helix-turn-helix domain-containing protein n=1 Tax=Streptomyces sp. SID13726 TaxID=2706058 RepID=UPI001EF24B62|nr:helix-turn-helix domain-containing protein [Streptomyces sp. SID13726]
MDTAEMRILLAHSEMIRANIANLGPFGVQAAKNTLTELARAVVLGRLDDTETRFAPALAEAAKNLANRLLNDPELSVAMLARELNVSVRTLQRSFASSGDSISSYIRNRRLEGARLELAKPHAQLSISEIAARWQFADSSHFIRSFRKRYSQTPSEYARSNNFPIGQGGEIRPEG